MIQYFSYGSNLHQAHLNRFCEKEGRPTIELRDKTPRRAILKDYKLDFNYYSNLMDGGAANLEPSAGEQVEGVVFEMTDEDMITLDLRERAPDYFYRIEVGLTLIDGGGTLSHVVAYAACEDKKTPFTPPTREYKSVIIAGAKSFELSPEWIDKLEALPEQDH
jgi:hypothetical protein